MHAAKRSRLVPAGGAELAVFVPSLATAGECDPPHAARASGTMTPTPIQTQRQPHPAFGGAVAGARPRPRTRITASLRTRLSHLAPLLGNVAPQESSAS
jgi:hypothetical protein